MKENIVIEVSYAKSGSEHPTNTEWLERDGRWCAVASEDDITIEDISGHTPQEAFSKLMKLLCD